MKRNNKKEGDKLFVNKWNLNKATSACVREILEQPSKILLVTKDTHFKWS